MCYSVQSSGFPPGLPNKEDDMNFLFIAIALWNTVVAAINVFVLPQYLPSEAMVYVTPTSQLLPIAIPIAISMLLPSEVKLTFNELRSKFI